MRGATSDLSETPHADLSAQVHKADSQGKMSEQAIVLAQATQKLLKFIGHTHLHPFTVQLFFFVTLLITALCGIVVSARNASTASVKPALRPPKKSKTGLPKGRTKKKWWKNPILKSIISTVIPLLVPYFILLYLFHVTPILLDLSANHTLARHTDIPKTVKKIHQEMFIADLHADTLMFSSRPGFMINSIKHGSTPPHRTHKTDTMKRLHKLQGKEFRFGHVDLDRLIAGNVGLQVFSVVSQIPRTLNMHRNSNSTNLAPILGLLSGWSDEALRGFGWTMDVLCFLRRFIKPVPGIKIQEGDGPGMRIIGQYARVLSDSITRSGDRLMWIRTKDDLEDLLEKRSVFGGVVVGALFSIEGTFCCDAAYANSKTGDKCAERLYELGVRMVGLTHFVDVTVAGSSTGESRAGLTIYGRDFVKRCFELGMAVDFAHASDETVRDVLSMPFETSGILVSHTGLRSLCNVPRNFPDDLVVAVGKRGGIVGITIFNEAHCMPESWANNTELSLRVLDKVSEAVSLAVKLAGVDNVGIGSDYDGGVTVPIDSGDIAMLTQTLLDGRFSIEQVKQVMGGNVLRWMQRWLK